MVTAMANSTQAAGKVIQPKAEMAREILCPTVNAVIHFKVGFHNEKLKGK